MTRWLTLRVLFAAAVVLGALAAVAGDPPRPEPSAEHSVTAVDLAQWIRARRPAMRVIDSRSAEEFGVYHLPGARSLPLTDLEANLAGLALDDTLVLYSDATDPSAGAAAALRERGFTKTYFLRGGLAAWLDQVMNPTLAAAVSPQRRRGC